MGKQSIGQKVTEKIGQKIDTYYDKKDRDSDSRITTDEKITRDVAGSLKRQVQYRLDKQAELQEKVKEYNERKADFIQRKLAEGMTEKEATKLHASVYKKPQINERKLLDPNVGTVTKESVMLAYMKFNQDATKIQAHTFTDQFVSKYMSGEEKKIHPIDKEKREKKGQTFAPKDQNNVVYKLNEKGQDLAVQRTKREELVNTITTIVKARQDINYKIKDVTFKLKEQSFNMKLLGLYSTGKIDQRKYIQLRDQKYLEYSKFKLAVLQTFGVLSARQVRQAWRAQKREYNPNSFIRTAVREGRLSKEEAQELRYKVFAEVKEAKRLEKEALDSRAIAKAQEGRSQSQSSSRFDYERERGFG